MINSDKLNLHSYKTVFIFIELFIDLSEFYHRPETSILLLHLTKSFIILFPKDPIGFNGFKKNKNCISETVNYIAECFSAINITSKEKNSKE